MGVNARILEKSGAWYAYNGEKIGQGRDNAREFLRENTALAIEIENKVRESLGIPLLAVSADKEPAKEKTKGKAKDKDKDADAAAA
jgi:recombination protein RecA